MILNMTGGGGDKSSTLPPPVSSLTMTGGDQQATVSFELLGEEHAEYLNDKAAYIVVVKQGSVPENPKDGTVIVKLDKTGAEV